MAGWVERGRRPQRRISVRKLAEQANQSAVESYLLQGGFRELVRHGRLSGTEVGMFLTEVTGNATLELMRLSEEEARAKGLDKTAVVPLVVKVGGELATRLQSTGEQS
jgi:hypothetical protein